MEYAVYDKCIANKARQVPSGTIPERMHILLPRSRLGLSPRPPSEIKSDKPLFKTVGQESLFKVAKP